MDTSLITALFLALGLESFALSSDEFGGERLDDKDVAAVSGRIESVVAGAAWPYADTPGEYRLIISRCETAEQMDHAYYIQWIEHFRFPHIPEVTRRSVKVSELDGYILLHHSSDPFSIEPERYGQGFRLTAVPRGSDDAAVYTITPHPDFTYSIVSHSELLSYSTGTLVGFVLGGVLGSLLVYRKLGKHGKRVRPSVNLPR